MRRSLLNMAMLFFTLSLALQVYGQREINISLGFAAPEGLNTGIRYQYGQAQFGMSLGKGLSGFFDTSSKSGISCSADLYFHFAGYSSWSDRHPYYFRTGLNYSGYKLDKGTNEYVFLPMRFGMEKNLTDHLGYAYEGGYMFVLNHNMPVHNGGFFSFSAGIFLRIFRK